MPPRSSKSAGTDAVAFFDLDRTLIDCNSGRLWMQAEWRAGRVGLREVLWGSWWLARYSLGFEDDLAALFEVAVATMAGQSEAEMDARVQRWFDAEVAPRLRPGARAALQWHATEGHRCVLATSSSIYAGRASARHWSLDDVIATEFGVAEGRFTGRVAQLAAGDAKAERVRRWAEGQGVALEACWFYTDSMTDLALLECVGHPVVVHPDRRLRRHAERRGWPIEDWGHSSGRPRLAPR